MSEYKRLCKKVEKATKILTENIEDPNAMLAFMYFCHSQLSHIAEKDVEKAVRINIKGKTSKLKIDEFWDLINV